MKKIIKLILAISMFLKITNIKALTYSDWKEEYPEGINEMLIEKEERYKWFIEKRVNEEYLKEDEGTQQYIDKEDTKEIMEKYDEKPEVSEEKIVIKNEGITLTCEDTTFIMIRNLNSWVTIDISEIEIYNKHTNEKIEYTLEDENNNFLKDKDLETFHTIGLRNSLFINLNKKYNVNDLKIIFYYKYTGEEYYITHYFSYKNKICLDRDNAPLTSCSENCKLIYEPYSACQNISFTETFYYVKETLYKKYDLEKEYTEEYLKEKEGYIKDEETKKTFYRYITDEEVLISNGKVVTDESICQKDYCYILKTNEKPKEEIKEEEKEEPKEEIKDEKPIEEIKPKDEEILKEEINEKEPMKENEPKKEKDFNTSKTVPNPKTSDNIKEILIQMFISSLISISLIIFIIYKIYVLKKHKRKTLSTFVESL